MKRLVILFVAVLSFVTGQGQIIFNEVEADAGNFENSGGEWMELKNIGSLGVDMSCWKISNGSTEMTIPFGLVLAPNNYLLIGNASKMMCASCDFKELGNLFTLGVWGFGMGSGAYSNTMFLNTDNSSNGGCDCLFGSGALNNGNGTGDRLVLFDENGNIIDAMMYGGGNNYGSNNLPINFSSTTTCAPFPGLVIPATSSSIYDGRRICNDVASCNSSFARIPDGNNGSVVTWNQTGNLSCTNCTFPCGASTNTASDDMPTPGIDNSVSTWSASLNGNPITSFNTPITVCGPTPITFIYESNNFRNTATTAVQPSGLLGSYVTTNNGAPTNFTTTSFNPVVGNTTLVATLTPGSGTTNYTFVMGESNVNCSSCPGTSSTADVNNAALAAKECYITRTVTVVREEPLGGTPSIACSILGSITVSGATGTNVKYELQKQVSAVSSFTTITGPQSSNLFSGVVDDDADTTYPKYQVLITTQNTVCSNAPVITVPVPVTCLGNPVCAAFVSINPGAPTFTPVSGSNVCAASTVQFTVDITGVCTNGTVDLLYSYNSAFDPYVSGTLLGSAPTTVGTTPPSTIATGKVFINEIAPRPPLGACSGTPNGQNPNSGEWVELYNAGPGNVDIGGWSISDGDWTATIPAGVKLLANNYYLIGGGGTFCSTGGSPNGQVPDLNVETCNCTTVSPSTQDIMNLTDGNEQVVLFDCNGTLVDGVLWNNGQGLPDAVANTALATGCGNYITQKNVTLPAGLTSTGGSLSGGTNIGRYRTSANTWVTTTTALTNSTPKAANPGGNWNGTTIPFGSQCPPPPVTATLTVTLPDTCDQFNATNLTVKAIYKPDPVIPCTKSAVTAVANYTIPPCTLLTLSGNGEYCVPNTAPVTLTPSSPLVGNYNVVLSNGTNTVNVNAISGAGPFNASVGQSGTWTITNIVPPNGVCAPKKVGNAAIVIHPIPVITASPVSVGSCYQYGYDLANINPLMTTNPAANTFFWYDSLTGGNLISPTLVYPSAATTYYAEPSTGYPAYCNGTRVPVVVDVTPIPDVPSLSCVGDTLKILPLAQNCVPTPCTSGVDYSADGLNWSSSTAYTNADPGWMGWGSSTNNQLYIRNLASTSCYIIVTYFSPCNSPLPTTLFGFNGNLLPNQTTLLHWQTGAENSGIRYEIERSSHKQHFEKLGMLPAQGGEGNHQYSFIDQHPLSGDNYYRIKIINQNGEMVYSDIINVNTPVEQTTLGAVYPNPSVHSLSIEIASVKKDRATLDVLDMTGKTVYREITDLNQGGNTIQISTRSLAQGHYLLKCELGKTVTYRNFVKE